MSRPRDLLEREDELSVLAEAVDRLAEGTGGAVAIEGPPGIGKTALLEGAMGHLGEAGVESVQARCGEFELDFPFGVARQLFEHRVISQTQKARARMLDGAAAHAAPALGIETGDGVSEAAPGVDLPFTVIHGLYWLLAKLAEKGPLAVVVDDAHWCDDPSLRFLTYVVPRLVDLPVLLLVASRPAAPERAAAMGAILGGQKVERIVPGPLGSAGSRALLEQALEEPAEEVFANACHEASGGNPFLLSELATSLRADGIEPVAANAERVRNLVPAAVVHSVLMRIGRMPDPCGDLAAAVAVLGSEVEPRRAAALAGIGLDTLAEPLEGLERAGILAPERPLRFVHPLLREAVRAELPLARREALHASAADLLREEGAKADEVAHHLLDAPRVGARETVAILRQAAIGAVGGGAPEAAVTYLLRALAEPPSADVQAGLRYELGWRAGSRAATRVSSSTTSGPASTEPGAPRSERPGRLPSRAPSLRRGTFPPLSGCLKDRSKRRERARAMLPRGFAPSMLPWASFIPKRGTARLSGSRTATPIPPGATSGPCSS